MAADGSVIIEILGDARKFTKTLGNAANNAVEGLKRTAKGAAEAIRKTTAAISIAVAAAGTAFGVLTKNAMESYGQYEQLVGGVETLFKDSSGKVMEYANNAYKTAGLSANEYMDTVTSFSASLLQGLDGDTEKAADIADKAITDMADNANKMGTSMESIQYAYQGFAKQNYTMLDNLKLGYGGTASEMARLINESGVLGSQVKITAEEVNSVSFDKIIEAIHIVQERMGITGTTAAEAADTIEGSVNAMKAAWTNFVTGMADENQDIDTLTQNLVDSVVAVINNVVPRLQELLPRLISGLGQLAEGLLPYIPQILQTLLPALIQGATSLVKSVAEVLPQVITTVIGELPNILYAGMQIIYTLGAGIVEAIPQLLDAIVQAVDYIARSLREASPRLADQISVIIQELADTFVDAANVFTEFGPEIIRNIGQGISRGILKLQANLPQIIDAIVNFFKANIPALVSAGVLIIKSLAVGLVNNLSQIGSACVEIIATLAQELANALPELIPVIVQVILEIVDVLTDPDNLVMLINAAVQIITAIAEGIADAMPMIVEKIPELIAAIVRALKEALPIILMAVAEIAAAIIEGIIESIKAGFSGIFSVFKGGSKGSGGGSGRTPAPSGGSGRSAAPSSVSAYSANALPVAESAPALNTSAIAAARSGIARRLKSAVEAEAARVSANLTVNSNVQSASRSGHTQAADGGAYGNMPPIIVRPRVEVAFTGDLAQMGRIMNPVIKADDARVGKGI